MTPAQAWKLLGIAPTSERRDIRHAYAAKLKTIDPDTDIAGFERLREALATAERIARSGSVAGRREGPVEAAVTPAAPSSERMDQARPELPPAPVDPMLELRRRFEARLHRRSQRDDHAETLVSMFAELLADPRMEQVGYAEEFETWLAQRLLQSIPLSDPLVPLAVERFGWQAELKKARPRYAPARLAQHNDDLGCIARLSHADHKWHEVFARLQEPAPEAIDLADRLRFGPRIGELLASLRYYNPEVEYVLNPAHVALWEVALAKFGSSRTDLFRHDELSWFGGLVVMFLMLAVLRLMVPDPGTDPFARADRPMMESPFGGAEPEPSDPPIVVPGPREAASARVPGTGKSNALPPKIQACVDAGGKLEITATHYICRMAPIPIAPTPKPDVRAVDFTGEALKPAESGAAPPADMSETNPASTKAQSSAVTKSIVQEMTDCLKRGGDPKIVANTLVCNANSSGSAP